MHDYHDILFFIGGTFIYLAAFGFDKFIVENLIPKGKISFLLYYTILLILGIYLIYEIFTKKKYNKHH